MLAETNPDVFGIQEGLYNQVSFLKRSLFNYEYVGVGRDDGYSGGEHSAIFYSTEKFVLLDSGNFWLSETPDNPSFGWDANNIRIVTWVKLSDLGNNMAIYIFNTHFDHKGKVAQEKSAELLVKKIHEIVENNSPVFIIGDFNLLIGNERLAPITKNYYSAQRFAERSDNNDSYNGFGRVILNRNIDYILYNNAKALSYKTIIKDYGVPFISDHYPIISHFNYQ